jgi:hypothetical protein
MMHGTNYRTCREYSLSFYTSARLNLGIRPANQDDTETLLKTNNARPSCVFSELSASSEASQSRSSTWLGHLNDGLHIFLRLPIIRHFLMPFQWLDRRLTSFMSNNRFHGWRMGILLGSIMSSIVLSCNISILVLGAMRNDGFQNGFVMLMIREAEDMSWWSSAFHIVINVLSTLLLGASNYTMQVLSSPTRGEIDRAHSSNQWQDIGVLSLRNLGCIPRRRRFLCVILALSSIPIHLFYNSAVFFIGADNDYKVFLFEFGSTEYTNIYELSDAANKASNPSYKMLNSVETFRAYSSAFVSYGDVYIAIYSNI